MGGGSESSSRARKCNKLNTATTWETGETTIGVIPDFNNDSAVDGLNDKVKHVQLQGG